MQRSQQAVGRPNAEHELPRHGGRRAIASRSGFRTRRTGQQSARSPHEFAPAIGAGVRKVRRAALAEAAFMAANEAEPIGGKCSLTALALPSHLQRHPCAAPFGMSRFRNVSARPVERQVPGESSRFFSRLARPFSHSTQRHPLRRSRRHCSSFPRPPEVN